MAGHIKYIVPFNWSSEFEDFVCENNEFIESVYGSLPGYPGGRPVPHTDLIDQEEPSLERLSSVIDKIQAKGIGFHYVYNMSCTGNIYLTKKGRQQLLHEINSLYELGITDVIVSNFGLARLISKINPNIKIMMSVILNVTETDQLHYLMRQDFNCIGLVAGKGLIRNLPKLQRFIDSANGLKITVIANDFCPSANCPERVSDHNNTCAHKHLPFNDELGDQCYISPSTYCKKLVMEDYSMYLKAPIINPNDVDLYENIGVRHIKITDRVMPDSQLKQVCRAYFDRRYNGNYFDLFSYTSHFGKNKKEQKVLTELEVGEILAGGYDELRNHRASFTYQPYAQAEELSKSSFMEYFRQGHCDNNCFHEFINQNGCKHCEAYTNRYVRIDESAASVVSSNIDMLINCAASF